MSTKRALTDIAFDVLSEKKQAMPFKEIWQDVTARSGITSADISQFYADLMLDGRFANLKGNMWDLKQNRKFAETYIDVDSLDLDLDIDEEEYLSDEDEDYDYPIDNDEE